MNTKFGKGYGMNRFMYIRSIRLRLQIRYFVEHTWERMCLVDLPASDGALRVLLVVHVLVTVITAVAVELVILYP